MKSFSQILMVTSQSGISFGILNASYVYINLYLSIIFGMPDRGGIIDHSACIFRLNNENILEKTS